MSSLKGYLKKENKRKDKEERKYKTSAETLVDRIRKKLVENIQWYKETNRDNDIDEIEDGDRKNIGKENQWKPMKRKKRRKNRGSPEKRIEIETEKRQGEDVDEMEYIRGVFFVPHTENSEQGLNLGWYH